MTINFELEDDQEFSTWQYIIEAAAPVLKPLAMPPITAVVDPGFVAALKANSNRPIYVKPAH